jgi:arylsulfatase A-like enzyme
MPTFRDLTGSPVPDGVDGVSILPTLVGRKEIQIPHKYLCWEFTEENRGIELQAVRMGKWKAVWDHDLLELYDLEADIGESVDVAARHPEVAAQLELSRSEAHRDYSANTPLRVQDTSYFSN